MKADDLGRGRAGLAWALVAAAGLTGSVFAQGEVKEDESAEEAAKSAEVERAQPRMSGEGFPRGAQPQDGAAAAGDMPVAGAGDTIEFSAFAEPLELSTLIDFVARTLNINVVRLADVQGTVVFNAPVAVERDELLPLLSSLLDMQGFSISKREDFYVVQQAAAVSVNVAEEWGTTRVFSTPNLRPSALKPVIESQFGIGAQGGGGGGGGLKAAYVDELGIIVVTDTPRRLDAIKSVIDKIQAEYNKSQYIKIDLQHVSAAVARARALQLIGQLAQPLSGVADGAVQGNINQQNVPGRGAPVLDNLGDRLTIDPQGNALFFRGLPEEAEQVRRVMRVIDTPHTLSPKSYFAGSSASQIADIARQRGLGEVIVLNTQADPTGQFNVDLNRLAQQQGLGGGNQTSVGGPVMVVDARNGRIIYYGTPEQHNQLEALVDEIDTQSERIVIREYKLKHSDSEQVAELILGLLQNQTPTGDSPLLPDEGGAQFLGARPRTNQPNIIRPPGEAAGAEGDLSLDASSFVIADTANNQILVKATVAQQGDFAKLIEKLDLRRPQVYVEAKIVSVTWSDTMRLAFETQLINANGTGGVLNTNFGLGSFGTDGSITGSKTVATGLGGLTAALIKSEYVPIIINALQREADTQLLSTPALLVDDNEDAEIVSLEQQPTTSISRTTGNPDVTSFAGYEDAGTTLRVTPQISEGGYLRLKYEVELSNFIGEGGGAVPPPRLQNSVKSESVTVPSDTTVIVGGLTVDSKQKTIAKVPFLGDIPILGLLFQDRNTGDRKTTLYIFLTPRILRDPNFNDLRLLTDGPRSKAGLSPEFPPMEPSVIDIVRPGQRPADATRPATPPATAPAPETQRPAPIELPGDTPAPAAPDPAATKPAAPPPPRPSQPGQPGPSYDDPEDPSYEPVEKPAERKGPRSDSDGE